MRNNPAKARTRLPILLLPSRARSSAPPQQKALATQATF